MGLFSSKKIISVSSTLYNMAGPEEDRPDFLKGVLFSSVLSNSPSLADDITTSYFEGPGLKQRAFFRYADRNDIAGLPTATVSNNSPVDAAVVAPHIDIPATPAGLSVVVQNSQLADGDPEPFCERWVLENHPDRFSEEWLGEVNQTTGMFSVQFENGDFFEFEELDYNPYSRYVIANYLLLIEDNELPLQEGTDTTVTSQVDLSGFTEESSSGAFQNVTLDRNADVTETFSDGSFPNNYSEDASVAATLNRSVDVYERTKTVGNYGYETEALFERYTYTGSDTVVSGFTDTVVTHEDIGGGVTKTTTKEITGEQVQNQWTEKHDTQQLFKGTVYGNERVFIYQIGTGIADLDALADDSDTSNFQEFFPFLPLRMDNTSVRDEPFVGNGLYEETKKAYRRAADFKSIDKLLDSVEDNESIGDIDYAYVVYGVSLNVQEQACRKYIYKFFQNLVQFQNTGPNTMADWEANLAAYQQALDDIQDWENTDWSNTPWDQIPPRPTIPKISIPEVTSLNLRTDSPLMSSYDIRMQWVHIEEDLFTGKFPYVPLVGNPRDAKKGEVMLAKGSPLTWTEREGYRTREGKEYRDIDKSIPSLDIFWQTGDNEYRRLRVYGLTHYNYIYGGKAVIITSSEAMDDDDISGFLVPMHYPTMKDMGIVDYTQMATANVHILFNSYTITKQKWYQRGIFKILLIILIIIIAVVLFPGSFAAAGGLLGANAAIGAALGLTGTAALVAGAVANYLASVIVSQVLSLVGTSLFGEKWGAVFAAIASFVLGATMSGMNLWSAQGILSLGNALANGYAGWVQGDIAEMNQDFEGDMADYENQMNYINDLIAGLGVNDLNFNPIFLTDSVQGNDSGRYGSYIPETAEEFIQRTTMVGSDVVEISFSMVYDFVEVQQTLPRS